MDILFRCLNVAWMLTMPLALGVFLARRLKTGWRPYLIGVGTFLGSQILHIPFNSWLLSPAFDRLGLNPPWQGTGLIVAACALGLSAGVFEEGARYIVLRRWLRDARTWSQGVMFGAGHGGVEAVAVGVITLIALFQAVAYRDADLSSLVPPDQLSAAQAQLAAYWEAPPSLIVLGSVERAIALCVQISLAVVVVRAVTRGNPAWLALAIGWHAFTDALAVFVATRYGPYLTEGVLAVVAFLSLGMLFKLRTPNPSEPDQPTAPPQAEALEPFIPSTPRNSEVEDSRFLG
jgi:uncharacterized membrane protein YhfC